MTMTRTLTLDETADLLKTSADTVSDAIHNRVALTDHARDVLAWVAKHKPDDMLMASHLIGLAREARKRTGRAKHRTIAVDAATVVAMYYEGNGRCALSGIPFDLAPHGASRRRPFAPSLDRISSAKGYHRGNVRLVCCAVNFLMNEWGDAVFHRLATAIRDSP